MHSARERTRDGGSAACGSSIHGSKAHIGELPVVAAEISKRGDVEEG